MFPADGANLPTLSGMSPSAVSKKRRKLFWGHRRGGVAIGWPWGPVRAWRDLWQFRWRQGGDHVKSRAARAAALGYPAGFSTWTLGGRGHLGLFLIPAFGYSVDLLRSWTEQKSQAVF